jgi:hypothetical protein
MNRFAAVFIALVSTASAAGAANAQAVCPGKRLDVSTPPFGSSPYVQAKLAGKSGPWSVDFGWTNTAVSSSFWKRPAGGGMVSLSGLAFPGAPAGSRSYPVTDLTATQSGVGQAHGIVGTDLLKDVVTEFHFEDADDSHVVISKVPVPLFRSTTRAFFVSVRPISSAQIPPAIPPACPMFRSSSSISIGASRRTPMSTNRPGYELGHRSTRAIMMRSGLTPSM